MSIQTNVGEEGESQTKGGKGPKISKEERQWLKEERRKEKDEKREQKKMAKMGIDDVTTDEA